jgi:uncharacterized protein (DUF885 family)
MTAERATVARTGGLIFLLLFAGCGDKPSATASTATIAVESQRLTEFLDTEFDQYLALNPDVALSMGLPVHSSEITDRSEAGDAAILAWRRGSVARMQAAFNADRLNDVARAAYDTWAFELTMNERRAEFPEYPYWLGGLYGAHTLYPRLLMMYHRVDDAAAMEAYVARLSAIGRAIDQLLARMQSAAGDGIRMPRFQYDKTIESCRQLITGAPYASGGADSALWADAEAKIARLVDTGKISPAQAEALEAQVRSALLNDFAPVYQRVIGWFASDMGNAPVGKVGVGQLPNGAAWYEATLFLNTTTPLTAAEIHEIGLAEVARIRKEMQDVKVRTGFTGSMAAFFAYLRTDPHFYLPNTDAGRADYIALADSYFGAMRGKLPAYFGRLPKADLVVRRVEPFREEAGGAANYSPPAADGSTPGVYYVHLLDMGALPLWDLESTAYHEGIPGHHLQLAIQRELTGVPRFLNGGVRYNAFSEGWALYTEPLAKEMGFYQDPYSDFGRLAAEQWRAVRLVIDTGLHAQGWTEDEAVTYFLANVPMPEAAARSEVQRYLTMPGQAVSYKIGMMTIQRLRDQAKAALGDRFDYRAFHDVVLGVGTVPLPVLEARAQRWIDSERDAA